jgi:hypothetical protein
LKKIGEKINCGNQSDTLDSRAFDSDNKLKIYYLLSKALDSRAFDSDNKLKIYYLLSKALESRVSK